ncbi:hypothetical protein ACLKA7_014692 [Drosophila subpalustris]
MEKIGDTKDEEMETKEMEQEYQYNLEMENKKIENVEDNKMEEKTKLEIENKETANVADHKIEEKTDIEKKTSPSRQENTKISLARGKKVTKRIKKTNRVEPLTFKQTMQMKQIVSLIVTQLIDIEFRVYEHIDPLVHLTSDEFEALALEVKHLYTSYQKSKGKTGIKSALEMESGSESESESETDSKSASKSESTINVDEI